LDNLKERELGRTRRRWENNIKEDYTHTVRLWTGGYNWLRTGPVKVLPRPQVTNIHLDFSRAVYSVTSFK
jgi:hypothetical protein